MTEALRFTDDQAYPPKATERMDRLDKNKKDHVDMQTKGNYNKYHHSWKRTGASWKLYYLEEI